MGFAQTRQDAPKRLDIVGDRRRRRSRGSDFRVATMSTRVGLGHDSVDTTPSSSPYYSLATFQAGCRGRFARLRGWSGGCNTRCSASAAPVTRSSTIPVLPASNTQVRRPGSSAGLPVSPLELPGLLGAHRSGLLDGRAHQSLVSGDQLEADPQACGSPPSWALASTNSRLPVQASRWRMAASGMQLNSHGGPAGRTLMAGSDVRAFAFCPRPSRPPPQAGPPTDDEAVVRAYMAADLRHRNGID
jgi:hypothetical protein